MKKETALWAGALLAAAAALYLLTQTAPPAPAPGPAPLLPSPLAPLIKPSPVKPCPGPNCPRQIEQDREPAIDLLAMPESQRKRNVASRGMGCCTFRSAEYAAWWQNVPALHGLPEWMIENGIQGGGTPPKQAALVERIARIRGLPTPGFVQYTGNDPATMIELALRTGRLPCITWNDGHMLVAVHLDEASGAILDNNDPGRVRWMSREDLLRQCRGSGGAWVFVLTAAAPPPPPAGARRQAAGQEGCPLRGCRCDCGCLAGEPCRCASFAWKPHWHSQASDWLALYQDGEELGIWVRSKGTYHARKSDGNYGPPCPCPAPTPASDDVPPGVNWTVGGVESYWVGASKVSRAEAEATLADDSALPHLTLFGGSAAQRTALLAPLSLAGRYRVQSYDAGDWALTCGFTPAGEVTACVQSPEGTVLLRCAAGADLAERLRRADPTYQPNADPDGAPRLVPQLPADIRPYLPWALGGGAALMALLALRQGNRRD